MNWSDLNGDLNRVHSRLNRVQRADLGMSGCLPLVLGDKLLSVGQVNERLVKLCANGRCYWMARGLPTFAIAPASGLD